MIKSNGTKSHIILGTVLDLIDSLLVIMNEGQITSVNVVTIVIIKISQNVPWELSDTKLGFVI